MVIKEDGTKWACQSCLKGHRVSGCNHTDRELHFVPKKGRPVTQCSHCRSERRKRSHHVRCGCGEKDHASKKCVHLQGKDGHHAEGDGHDLDPVSEGDGHGLGPLLEGEESDEHTCCCHHGEKCRCSKAHPKQADLDHVRAQDKVGSKPRLTATASESHVTGIGNHHHKAMARNHSSHDVNSVYRVHKPHPIHGIHPAGRRSVDSLATTEKSAKTTRPHLHNLAPALGRPVGTEIPISTADAENSHAAFTIPMDGYLLPSGHEDLFAAFPGEQDQSITLPKEAQISRTARIVPYGRWPGSSWEGLVMSDTTQPALTYASSNTISEFGEHTPPEENKMVVGDLHVANELLDTTAPLSKASSSTWSAKDESTLQAESQQNRWSLPPSYWSNIDDGANFLDFGPMIRNEKDTQTGAVMPPNCPLQPRSASGNHRSAFDNIMSGSVFGGGAGNPTQASSAFFQPPRNMTPAYPYDLGTSVQSNDAFDFAPPQATTEEVASYQANQSDPFFGLDDTDTFNMNADMTVPDLDQQWPS